MWLPALLLLPDCFRAITPGLPDPTFGQAAMVPLLGLALWRYGRGWQPRAVDLMVLAYAGLVGASDWYAAQAAQLTERLGHVPTLLLWGTRDAFVGETWLLRWQEHLPEARTVRLDCGHFGPEERPAETVAALRLFLAEMA